MMIESTTAISIFEKILDVFGLVKAGRIKRDNQVDMALKNTYKALVETQAYIRIINAQERNYQKEQ